MVEAEDRYCEEQRTSRPLALRNELGLSMAFIRESTEIAKDDLAVFPPINHENLYIDGFDRDRESPSESSSPTSSSDSYSSSSSLSPSDSDGQFEFDRKLQCQLSETDGKSPPSDSDGKSRWKFLNYYSTLEIDIIQGWCKLFLARILSKFQKLVTWFSRNSLCSFSRTLRSYYPILVIVIWWWMRNRARRRLHEGEIKAHLRNTIKERDERIIQLLHQIAQMNELLLIKKKHSD